MQLVLLHTCQKAQPPKVHSKDGLTCNGRVLCRVDDGAVAADRNDKVAAFRQCGVIFAERDVFILPAVLFVHECFRTVFLQNRQNFPGVCVRIAFIQIWNHRNFHKPQSFLSSAA